MRLLLRWPSGRRHPVDFCDEATCQTLLEFVGSGQYTFRHGYPPQKLDVSDKRKTLRDIGLQTGCTLIIEEFHGKARDDDCSRGDLNSSCLADSWENNDSNVSVDAVTAPVDRDAALAAAIQAKFDAEDTVARKKRKQAEASDAAFAARLHAESTSAAAAGVAVSSSALNPTEDADAAFAAMLQAEELKEAHRYSSNKDGESVSTTTIAPPAKRQRSKIDGVFMPFRLLAVRHHINDGGNEEAVSFRQMVGAGRVRANWVICANYLVDPCKLRSEWPELAAVGKVVIFHGGRSQMNAGDAATLPSATFVNLDPKAEPGSRSNPLKVKARFGVHHTKMFLVGCDNGLRVVVHTANILERDLSNKSQGAYVQDFPLKTNSDSVSSSSFERVLVSYITSYGYNHETVWPGTAGARSLCSQLAMYDFSGAYAELVPSVPGTHHAARGVMDDYGHRRLRRLVAEYGRQWSLSSPRDTRSTGCGEIVCQFSSLGSLHKKWLLQFALSADVEAANTGHLSKTKGSAALPEAAADQLLRKIKLVWPTVEEVRTSEEGYVAGLSIPGPSKNVNKDFLRAHFCHWGSERDSLQRTTSAPHIKTYCQLASEREGNAARSLLWACLTSHNLSKAAWGESQKNDTQLKIEHWELGVFFSPVLISRRMAENRPHFSLTDDFPPLSSIFSRSSPRMLIPPSSSASSDHLVPQLRFLSAGGDIDKAATDVVCLPLPFDLPPRPYNFATTDVPWTWDTSHMRSDRFGRVVRRGEVTNS